MKAVKTFYSKAIDTFREFGGTEEELMWLVGSRLALFPSHREEIMLRLRAMEEIVRRAEGKILDVGSGSGLLALALSEKGIVTGVEKAPDFFPFLRTLENERLKFIQGDFLRDDVGRDFDVVVFSYILHDLEPEPFLRRAIEVLARDGRIILGDFDLNMLRSKVRAFADENCLRIVEDVTLGRAKTHGSPCEAFLIVIETGG
ncbi:class I SAM-dependent methyltransferase [Thermococcus sp. 21S7]|uniref:class I SAM-dependent methyltransferase n=1 Tax=Thermococcus sp. 21S7 TaxID=1638221 RepID=UPI001439D084|nr:class I SAM-dependent methyltransferase [Thermococcus sp. 21S7]